ncbi:MAG: YifB family Mg chelatase-like AAA ATPase [Candidatus Falkowbacteria bacterium]|nr:YifB family Mg chelatase-like AAA ATPase [Candidatus Falkowbacteria bacterium]
MSTKIWSAALNGLDAKIIAVEADSGGGDFGQITIVGLPDMAVSESKERVRSALRNCGLPFPRRKITVNLAPADLKKRGPAYDLPIAISILALNNKFATDFSRLLLVGELSLSGEIRPINGVLSMAMAAKQAGLSTLFVPYDNAAEAGLIGGLIIFPVVSLQQTIQHLKNKILIPEFKAPEIKLEPENNCFDFNDIKGQEKAKRALEIAAAGGHNLLFCGPPGSGKTMLARAMPGILPDLVSAEKLEITKIYSAAGELKDLTLINRRPFRSPHHSASVNSLIGGGAWPRPGEISLAHRGVLFLDEFPEFSRSVLENLRQPLEEGFIHINRTAAHLKFPARFTLLAAMNPCPCGYFGSKEKPCRCADRQITVYRRRLSGPILDRIDLHATVDRTPWEKLTGENTGDSSTEIKTRVEIARKIQSRRFKNYQWLTNAEIPSPFVKNFCPLNKSGEALLNEASEKMKLSTRAYFKILKLARTIADLNQKSNILPEHIAEALQYRPKLD